MKIIQLGGGGGFLEPINITKIIQVGRREGGLGLIKIGFNYLFRRVGSGLGLDFGRFGKGNAGYIAHCQAQRWLLNKEFPGSKVSWMTSRKLFTQEDIDVINKADVLFVGSGGLFLYDTFQNSVSDWQWGVSEDLLGKIEIPIVVYAIGYNKFRGQREFNENFNKTVTKLVEKAVFFSMRNTGSCNAVKKHIPQKLHDRIKLNYCPSLLFNDKFNFKRSSLHDNLVGFVIAGDRLKNRHRNLDKYVKHMKTFVEYLRSKGVETILIDHANDSWIRDYVQFDKFIRLVGEDSKCIYKVYSEIGTVVGDRGHAQMVPFACGCKILTPISHDKLRWFLEDMGLQEFGIEESDDDLCEKLIEKFNRLNSIDWKGIQEEKMKMIKETNRRNLEFIKEQICRNASGSA